MALISTLRTDRRGKLPILVLALVLVVALLGTGVLLVTRKGSARAHHKPAEKEQLVALEEFVLNLADVAEPHYLKLEVNLGIVGDAASGGGHGEGGALDEYLPVIRDAVISTAGHYSYNDLLTAAGKESLKNDLKKRLESTVEGLKIKRVYFTNFAMQ